MVDVKFVSKAVWPHSSRLRYHLTLALPYSTPDFRKCGTGSLSFRVQIMILPIGSHLWHALKSSSTAFPNSGLACILKTNVKSCLAPIHPPYGSQSHILKMRIGLCHFLAQFPPWFSKVLQKKTYKAYFVDLSPNLDFRAVPSCLLQNLTPPSFPRFSLVPQDVRVCSAVI